MTVQILNGDALYDLLPENILSGDILIARECLIDGPLSGETPEEFWKTRAEFISNSYSEPAELYHTEVVTEFQKMRAIEPGSDVNLWFEDDLFCQVNLWYCISLLSPIDDLKIYLVKPPLVDGLPDWRGFGALNRDAIAKAYQERARMNMEEIVLLEKLWHAYKHSHSDELAVLTNEDAPHFPFLKDVVNAQLDRHLNRPQNTLRQILSENQGADFKTIFKEFSQREGIYGFGDLQVESLLANIPEYKVD